MTTLLSTNESQSFNLHLSTATIQKDGDMIVKTQENTDIAAQWLEGDGVSGIYFNPMGDVTEYNDYIISKDSIRFYNS